MSSPLFPLPSILQKRPRKLLQDRRGAVGVLVGVNGSLALATVLSFAIVLYFSRYVSLASMVAAVFAPVFYLFGNGVAWQATPPEVLSLAVMALLLVMRHRENINRLLAGTESKLGQKKA